MPAAYYSAPTFWKNSFTGAESSASVWKCLPPKNSFKSENAQKSGARSGEYAGCVWKVSYLRFVIRAVMSLAVWVGQLQSMGTTDSHFSSKKKCKEATLSHIR